MKVKYEREKKQILKYEGKREGASIVVQLFGLCLLHTTYLVT